MAGYTIDGTWKGLGNMKNIKSHDILAKIPQWIFWRYYKVAFENIYTMTID